MLDFFRKWISIGKKLFIVIAVYFVVMGLFLHFIRQDKPKVTYDPIKENRTALYKVINDPQLNKSKEGKVIVTMYRAVNCGLTGEACTDNPNDADKLYSRSIFGMMSNLITLPYKYRPASGIYWAYTGLANAGFIPKTYAAEGIGFAALSPIMNLWKVFRDVAYMLLALVLIAIGFMIMFRMKLNPQTVISVENALPRIVISLILITFSFAIAGFLIDLMYIIITLGIAVMSDRGNFYNITEFQNKYLNAGFGEIWSSMFPAAVKYNLPGTNANTAVVGGVNGILGGAGSLMMLSKAFMNLIPDVINQIIRSFLGFVGVILIGNFVIRPLLINPIVGISNIKFGVPVLSALPGIFSLILRIVVGGVIIVASYAIGYSLLPLVLFVLIGLTILLMLFRIFLLLFATYLKILLMIVFSPIFMLFEALPGKNAFGYWFKNLFAELITFPVVVILFVITYVIIHTPTSVGNLWTPPFLTDINPNAFTALLGFGIMFQIPDFIKLVKELIGAKDMPVGLNLGTFFGGATGVGGGAIGMLSQIGTLSLGIDALGKLKKGVEGKLGRKTTS